MVSLELEPEPVQGNLRSSDAPSSPRISFSAEFLDDNNFISICPNPLYKTERDQEKEQHEKTKNITDQFEFLSTNNNMSNNNTVLSADELFFDGKILPFWQMQHLEKLNKINIKEEHEEVEEEVIEVVVNSSNKEDNNNNNNSRVNWFVDDDPSPRPPKCTVLWKELLRLKKQRASSLSPSSSSSSSSSNASSLGDVATKEGSKNKENQHMKRIKKGLERTRSATIRIRPMINVPICTQMKNSSLPPLFPLKKGKILER
ncbi:membrane-associated kinase regulator protein [Trifolium repens]|jgi:hypothetical protein|nr:membrane-associated kinase regulator protein [Trifolium repens]